jgi:ABC-type branched-subunit amino acid transport system permease subunit
MIVFGLAQLEYVSLQRWEEVAGIVFGLWLIASPYMFGYSGDGLLRFYHSTLGSLVLLLAALQLWQDWDLSDQDMLKHGQ